MIFIKCHRNKKVCWLPYYEDNDLIKIFEVYNRVVGWNIPRCHNLTDITIVDPATGSITVIR
jgi:hypothetical protein